MANEANLNKELAFKNVVSRAVYWLAPRRAGWQFGSTEREISVGTGTESPKS